MIPIDQLPAREIPPADHIRHRLAVTLTEAGLLRAQLRVSARAEQQRERLRKLALTPPGGRPGD